LYLSAHWRAHPLKGDTTKAKVDYRDFLALWKDADPNDEDGNAGKAQWAKLKCWFGTTSEHLREKISFPITLSDG
jgi:hypothetical protein